MQRIFKTPDGLYVDEAGTPCTSPEDMEYFASMSEGEQGVQGQSGRNSIDKTSVCYSRALLKSRLDTARRTA